MIFIVRYRFNIVNAGKLVAQIAVVAIIVYCSYSAVISAIPMNNEDMKNPITGLDTLSIGTSLDGANLKVTVDGEITSNLPQDVVDTKFALFVGKGASKIALFELNLGNLVSKQATSLAKTISIPICTLLAYSCSGVDDTGKLTIPVSTQIAFKYFEWQQSYLVDLDVTVNNKQMPIETTVGVPSFSIDKDTNTATMTVEVASGGSTILESVLDSLTAGSYEFTCGDATFTADITKGSSIGLSLTAAGTADKTAMAILQEFMDAHEGKLTVTYGGNPYEIDSTNAAAFVEMLSELYERAGATA